MQITKKDGDNKGYERVNNGKSGKAFTIFMMLVMMFVSVMAADMEKIDEQLESMGNYEADNTATRYPDMEELSETDGIEVIEAGNGYMVKITGEPEGESGTVSVSSDGNVKIAYLTFDDGPSENTGRVLEILKQYDIRATFFLIGENVNEKTKTYLEEMTEAGHAIGIHTYSHDYDEIYSSKDAYYEDFNKAAEKIKEYTGVTPFIYRFPGGTKNRYAGELTATVMKELGEKGYICFDWNVSAEDSVGKPTEYSIMQNIKKDVFSYDKPVILMHDSSINELTAEMLPKIIELLLENGYIFDTLNNREQYVFNF